ncbi:MAG: hypothetical protein R3B57_02240 [Phycisphaerales bacterium]
MRLPLGKVWRAFPELDRFDDAVCAQYVAEAKLTRWRSGLLLLTLLLPGGAIACLIALSISLNITSRVWSADDDWGIVSAIWFAFIMFVPQTLVLSGVLMLRDRWLRAAVRDRLETMACTGCRYNLLGLRPLGAPGEQHVICPECGRHVKLTPEMLEQLHALGSG